jgi:hypothetical protein
VSPSPPSVTHVAIREGSGAVSGLGIVSEPTLPYTGLSAVGGVLQSNTLSMPDSRRDVGLAEAALGSIRHSG